jgi:peptide deformylase
VKGWDGHGEPKEMKASNMLARVIQHEVDHLEGVCQVAVGIERERGIAWGTIYITTLTNERAFQF